MSAFGKRLVALMRTLKGTNLLVPAELPPIESDEPLDFGCLSDEEVAGFIDTTGLDDDEFLALFGPE